MNKDETSTEDSFDPAVQAFKPDSIELKEVPDQPAQLPSLPPAAPVKVREVKRAKMPPGSDVAMPPEPIDTKSESSLLSKAASFAGRAVHILVFFLGFATLAVCGFDLVNNANLDFYSVSASFYGFWVLYLLMTVFEVSKGKWLELLKKSPLPIVVANTMTSWGMVLAIYALGVSRALSYLQSLQNQLDPQSFMTVVTVFSLMASGSVQLLLVALLCLAMFNFGRLFYWMKSVTAPEEMQTSKLRLNIGGLIIGAIIGLSGMYLALDAMTNSGNSHTLEAARPMIVHTLVWASAMLLALRFMAGVRKR